MRYESSGYGMPPFGNDSYRGDRDLLPSPGIPYYERDRLDDRDYYRRPPPSDYDRYRPSSGNMNGRGGTGRPSWRPQPDDRRPLDREREREKPYSTFNNRMNDPNRPQPAMQHPQAPSSVELQSQPQPSQQLEQQVQPAPQTQHAEQQLQPPPPLQQQQQEEAEEMEETKLQTSVIQDDVKIQGEF